MGSDHFRARNGFARFTAGQSDRVVGALATATRGAANAIGPRKCHRPRNDSVNNTDVQSCGSVGGPGTGTKVVLAVLKCHRLKNGSVASITNRSNPAVG